MRCNGQSNWCISDKKRKSGDERVLLTQYARDLDTQYRKSPRVCQQSVKVEYIRPRSIYSFTSGSVKMSCSVASNMKQADDMEF